MVCLACGLVLCGDGKGECTRHAAHCGGGAYFLLQECTVLLVHGPRACYSSPPRRRDGERHGQFRGRPLYLDEQRIEVVRKLWATHGVEQQVVQSRSNSRQVIINSYY